LPLLVVFSCCFRKEDKGKILRKNCFLLWPAGNNPYVLWPVIVNSFPIPGLADDLVFRFYMNKSSERLLQNFVTDNQGDDDIMNEILASNSTVIIGPGSSVAVELVSYCICCISCVISVLDLSWKHNAGSIR